MDTATYHITWTTYGTWLPGDERGWVQRGKGAQRPDADHMRSAALAMEGEAVTLTLDQRAIVESTIREHWAIRRWTLHAVNCRSNHVHVLLSADVDANEVMKQLKAWCSRKLSDHSAFEGAVARRAGRRRWFTEGGFKQVIENEDYLQNALRYVIDAQ